MALAVLCPGLLWLARNRAVWPWDQAWFGAHTVTLYETLRHRPLEWPAALAHATPLKPPAVAWIGQFFVPLGMAIGSVDAGLLLSIWLTHVAVLVVVYRALLELASGRTLPAAAGTLAVGGAPLFVVLSTQYLAEGTQTLAVAWFVLILCRAPRWPRARLAAHLVAAASFAMLAKTTSPVFCAVPGIVALAGLFRGPSPPGRAPRRWWALAAFLGVVAAVWYAINFQSALLLVRTASFGPVAELYGKRDTLAGAFGAWWMLAYWVFFLRPVALVLAALVVAGVARRGRAEQRGATIRADAVAGAALLQILVTLGVFSLSPVREPRYLEALLPLVAVVVTWAVMTMGDAAARVVAILLAVQLALGQSQVFGLWPARPGVLRAGSAIDPTLHRITPDPGPAADLAAIVQRTCPRGAAGVYNFVGVDLVELSGHALTYGAAKERLAGRAGDCGYVSVGFGSVEAAEATVSALPYAYWIAVDPDVHPVPKYHAFLNQSAPVVFRRLRRRGVLEPEPWDGPPGIQLFRFVRR